MDTDVLFYKIHKGKVAAIDYIEWSHSLLNKGLFSPSLTILASCSSTDNIFEVESYFHRAMQELKITQPAFETSARAQIKLLAMKITKAENADYTQIYPLTDKIFRVAAAELDYPDDLIPWIELSDLLDSVDYNYDKEIILKIKNEAKLLIGRDI